MNLFLSFALKEKKQRNLWQVRNGNVGALVVTYEFYVVLLIQKEVFYLQIPVRQREKKSVNTCTVSVFTSDNLSEPPSSYNAKAEEVSPPHAPTHKHPS